MPGRNKRRERRAFQAVLALLSLIPLRGLLIGWGPGIAYYLGDAQVALPADVDNQFRYLSGVYLAVTLAAWWTLPRPDERTEALRVVCAGVFVGALGRCISMWSAGLPENRAMLAGVAIEGLLVPLLLLWQRRLVRLRDALS